MELQRLQSCWAFGEIDSWRGTSDPKHRRNKREREREERKDETMFLLARKTYLLIDV